MIDRDFTSGRDFQRRLMGFLGIMSVLAVALIALYLNVLMRLSAQEWRGFLELIAAVGPTMFVGTSLLNRPLYRPVVLHLEAAARDRSTPADLHEAFRALSNLPYRFFLNGLFWWTAAGLFAAGVMAWRFEAFDAFRFAVMSQAAISGGFICSVFIYFGLKRIHAELLRELARRIGDPEDRQALVRRVDLGSKLGWSVTGVTTATVIFAVFLSFVHAGESLEANATRIQDRFLAARARALAVDPGAREQALAPDLELQLEVLVEEARELAIASEIVLVDPQTGQIVAGHSDALLASELAEVSAEAGNSLLFESPNAFAWRPLSPGGPVAVALQPWALVAPSATSGWARFGTTLLFSSLLALGLAHVLVRDIGAGTRELGENARRIAAGDLRHCDPFESEDELGDLARSFERMASSLRATLGRVSAAADRVEATAVETATVSESVGSAAEAQTAGVVETARAMQGVSKGVSEISASAHELNLLVEDAGSSIAELGSAGSQLAETASGLSDKVAEVSSSIEEGVKSMREVSTHSTALAEAAENTASSMLEMASAMRQVNAAAEDSAARSRRVVETAESGRDTVRQTVDSMESIRRATQSAESVIQGLGARAREIGSIVGVIGDVADETNLLALNAAIIAAQAGDQGRAFSVVAQEIKALADRVLTSTKEIGNLIGAVQEESANAAAAIALGANSVAEGVRLSNEAGASLEEITRVSHESGEQITQILGAVQEQTRAASYVVEQMESVKHGVDAIRRATLEQDRGNEVIVRSSEAMREIAQQLQATTGEQARGAGQIRQSIEGVRSATESITAALRSQTSACQQVGGFLDELSRKGANNEESAQRLHEVSHELTSQATALREDVDRFQV